MGFAKTAWMEEQYAAEVAKGLLVEVGYLKCCEFHSEIYSDCWEDLTPVYRIANARITRGDIDLPTGWTRRDFTDLIQKQAHAQADACWQCEKWKRD